MARADATAHIRVTKLHRAEHGEWEAHVTVDGGETVNVTRRYGSWMIRVDIDGGGAELFDMSPWLAAELQARLPANERKPRASVR